MTSPIILLVLGDWSALCPISLDELFPGRCSAHVVLVQTFDLLNEKKISLI